MHKIISRLKTIKQPKEKIIFGIIYITIIAIFYYFKVDCFFLTLFHIPCPGCGMTRAWLSLLHFDIKGAFLNHLAFWSAPILLLYFIFDGNILRNRKLNKWLFIIIVFFIVLNYILRLWAHFM